MSNSSRMRVVALMLWMMACVPPRATPAPFAVEVVSVSAATLDEATPQTTIVWRASQRGSYRVQIEKPDATVAILLRGTIEAAADNELVLSAAQLETGSNTLEIIVLRADGSIGRAEIALEKRSSQPQCATPPCAPPPPPCLLTANMTKPALKSLYYGDHDVDARTLRFAHNADAVSCSHDGTTFAACDSPTTLVFSVADYDQGRTLAVRFTRSDCPDTTLTYQPSAETAEPRQFIACSSDERHRVHQDESFAAFSHRLRNNPPTPLPSTQYDFGASSDQAPGRVICIDAGVTISGSETLMLRADGVMILGTETDPPRIFFSSAANNGIFNLSYGVEGVRLANLELVDEADSPSVLYLTEASNFVGSRLTIEAPGPFANAIALSSVGTGVRLHNSSITGAVSAFSFVAAPTGTMTIDGDVLGDSTLRATSREAIFDAGWVDFELTRTRVESLTAGTIPAVFQGKRTSRFRHCEISADDRPLAVVDASFKNVYLQNESAAAVIFEDSVLRLSGIEGDAHYALRVVDRTDPTQTPEPRTNTLTLLRSRLETTQRAIEIDIASSNTATTVSLDESVIAAASPGMSGQAAIVRTAGSVTLNNAGAPNAFCKLGARAFGAVLSPLSGWGGSFALGSQVGTGIETCP